MKLLTTIMIIGMLATPAAAEVKVIDGDTIILGREHIRIIGLDAPETYDAGCEAERRLGALAKARLTQLLLACGPLATLEPGTCLAIERESKPDRYGRTLAQVRVRGDDVATRLIDEGFADTYVCPGGHCAPRRRWCGG